MGNTSSPNCVGAEEGALLRPTLLQEDSACPVDQSVCHKRQNGNNLAFPGRPPPYNREPSFQNRCNTKMTEADHQERIRLEQSLQLKLEQQSGARGDSPKAGWCVKKKEEKCNSIPSPLERLQAHHHSLAVEMESEENDMSSRPSTISSHSRESMKNEISSLKLVNAVTNTNSSPERDESRSNKSAELVAPVPEDQNSNNENASNTSVTDESKKTEKEKKKKKFPPPKKREKKKKKKKKKS